MFITVGLFLSVVVLLLIGYIGELLSSAVSKEEVYEEEFQCENVAPSSA